MAPFARSRCRRDGLPTVPLAVTGNRYGYMGDELYFISADGHLAWGYVDQPPLLPLLAHTMDAISPVLRSG